MSAVAGTDKVKSGKGKKGAGAGGGGLAVVPDDDEKLAASLVGLIGTGKIKPDMYFGRNGILMTLAARTVLADGMVGRGVDGRLWVYEGGRWVPNTRQVGERVVAMLRNRYTRSLQTNIEAYLMHDRTLPVITGEGVAGQLNVANGMVDQDSGALRPHSPADRSTVQLPWDWNPGASCPKFLEFLGQCLPEDGMVDFMSEVTGYFLLYGNPYQRAFLLHGAGANGKSVYLRVLTELLGRANIAHVTLADLTGTNRFAKAGLFGKIANIAGDIDPRYIENTGDFKGMTGEDELNAEFKGKDQFTFYPAAKHIFSANEIPPSSDVTEGYTRRWVVVDWRQTFVTGEPGRR